MVIKEIIELSKNSYSEKDFHYHILPVVKNALMLAEKLNADKEVVEVAAYLHDIGRASKRDEFVKENEHHTIGAKKTREILAGFGCDEEFIKKVEHCVLTHRGRKGPDPETIEAEIIANADAMAHYDTFLDLFAFFLESGESFEDSIKNIDKKMKRNWEKKLTLPEAKEMVKEKYHAINLILKNIKEYIEE
jgi:uncharacterized protein